MKKTLVLISLLAALPCMVFSQLETNGQSRTVIGFGRTTLYITNNFITDSGRKGNIVVDITNENKNMLINIIDNGAGFSTQKETTGYGLSLTKQRIRLLNKKYKEQKIQLHINSNAAGTTVILTFNNWL